MLHDEVVEAVRNGKFHIYSVATIDEGIALLTGKEAGEKMEDGMYPEGTVNWAVQQKIWELAAKVRAFSSSDEGGEEKEAG